MKKISIVIPCYNDAGSITMMHERLVQIFTSQLAEYDYEIIYVDDRSGDHTWNEIKKVCAANPKAKGIRNMRNFGFSRNIFSSMTYGTGDATFLIFGDIQDPPEILPDFVRHWEEGYKVVVGARANSYNNFLNRISRNIYYKIIAVMTNNKQLTGVCGFGLYDKQFISILKEIDDIQPFLPGILTEYVRDIKIIQTVQKEGRKSNWNFWGRYDLAMISITSYTKTLLRATTFIGLAVGACSAFYALYVVLKKIFFWDSYSAGTPSVMAGIFFLGAIQIFFLGIIGEYILSMNNRSMKRPLVVIDEKIGFESERCAQEPPQRRDGQPPTEE
ncbi:MAG: glycosyltransferase family 2 protein [Deltaproteobacteria bacterium]|jgi:glycosyltransferase involved in cell wall biosynthesis|nr:glycosyltransferase family 2 protein [Deltaproteobacteria bacterium]